MPPYGPNQYVARKEDDSIAADTASVPHFGIPIGGSL